MRSLSDHEELSQRNLATDAYGAHASHCKDHVFLHLLFLVYVRPLPISHNYHILSYTFRQKSQSSAQCNKVLSARFRSLSLQGQNLLDIFNRY